MLFCIWQRGKKDEFWVSDVNMRVDDDFRLNDMELYQLKGSYIGSDHIRKSNGFRDT